MSEATPDRLSDAEYDTRTRTVLARIEAEVDRLLEEDVVDIDASRTGGLLEMRFPDGRVVVVNTQPPLQELWLASPSSGHHFRSVGGRWLDSRSGEEFFELLSRAASEIAARPVRLAA